MSHPFQPSELPGRMADGWRRHWPHYVAEAVGLAYFVCCASIVAVLLEHPLSPVRQAIGSVVLRRGVRGVVMGFVIVSIAYSPWSKSGAHINPAITVAFWRLGRILLVDARTRSCPFILPKSRDGIGNADSGNLPLSEMPKHSKPASTR